MAQYRAGDWHVLLTGTAAVMVAPETSSERVSALWEQLQSAPTLTALADALIGGGGGSFAEIPPFAVALREGAHVRIAVRGGLEARAESAAGAETITGENVTIWNERSIADARRVTLSVRGADAADLLPILGGVVRASSVIFDADAAVATGSGPSDGVGDRVDAVPAPEPVLAVPQPVEVSEPAPPVPEPVSVPESFLAVPEPPETPEPVSVPEPVGASEPVEGPGAEPEPISDVTLIPTDEDEDDEDDAQKIFDQLFADTVHSPNAVAASPAAGGVQGDHDGATISIDEARALRRNAPSAEEAPTAVLPVVPEAQTGRIRLSTGQVVSLDRTVIIGRRPRSTRASGTDLPHLIAVESPQQDISRNHLEIRPEADTVVVVDLHTTNGSTLLRPGADPVRLHPGEQTLVLSGDVIDLGDGVTVSFERLP